jgi:hypothetical protein
MRIGSLLLLLPLAIANAQQPRALDGDVVDSVTGAPVNGGRILFVSSSGVRSEGWVDSNGTLTASLMAAGEYRVYVISGQEESDSFHDPDFLAAHREDFPPVQIAEGTNAPLVLRMPGR